MKHLYLVLFSVFLVCWLAYLVILVRGKPAAAPKPEVATEASGANLEAARASERAAYEQATRARVAELAAMEADAKMRAQAAAKTERVLHELQLAKSSAWTTVISTNWQTFEALRREAVQSGSKTTTCTLCRGLGMLPYCIMCQNTGKCPVCGGSGKASFDEYCPACLGSGKCFLCAGLGRMICPFCDDGLVRADTPAPPDLIPLH